MNYQEATDFMDSCKQYGICPGLDSVRRLCGELGNPQEKVRFVHIAGTNGKGSTLAYLSSILKCAGYRVGSFSSPAVFERRESIRIGGRPITKKDYCEGVEALREACGRIADGGFPHPTAFEAETGLAFWYFWKKGCDVAVVETGMGGREDATNILENVLAAVIASISMDHMKFLGPTLDRIAWQKAGILRPGRPAVVLKQEEEAQAVVEKEAELLGCPLTVADPAGAKRIRYGMEKQSFDYGGYQNLEIGLAGLVQVENAVLALETAATLEREGLEIPEKAIRKGLREAKWPGRFTVIARRPLFVMDGAHNEDAARKLAQSVNFYFTNKRIIYIMGVLRDKEYGKIIRLTHSYADQILTVTPPENPRAMSAYELAQEVARVHDKVTAVDSLEEAVEMAYLLAGKEDVILAFGSLSYLGRLGKIVEKRVSGK